TFIRPPSTIAITSRSPHPHAAALLLDYHLSKEASEIMVKNQGRWAPRKDVPWTVEPQAIPMSFLLCTGGQKSNNWWTCLTRAVVSELFMSSLICGHLKFLPPRAEPLRARSRGLCLVGHHP